MRLFINQLIQYTDNAIERVIWIDPANSIAYTINVQAPKGMPVKKVFSHIIKDLENEAAHWITEDTYCTTASGEGITEKNRSIRDNAWAAISDIVQIEPDIFEKNKRGKIVQAAAEKSGRGVNLIYNYLRRYWQRGKNINALLPDYSNSGGRGKKKQLGSSKVGRPRKYPQIQGTGVNATEEIKRLMRHGINDFVLTEQENTLKKAHELTLRKYFHESVYFEDGVKKTILLPQAEQPTLTQFKYLYEEEYNIKASIIARKGRKSFEKDFRAILGNSTSEAIGPGSRYQIDATVADVYLVSRYNRNWIIGRPVIYVVIDVFSRMVVGLYVGLEGPSWLGAMMALTNTICDKVEFCAEYDISITHEKWPCFGLPEAIIADRGELLGKPVETLSNTLNVRIENTASFRPDWKGIVERYFRTTKEKVKPLLPGFIQSDFQQRGGKDYRLDAQLDIFQFTQIVIHIALHHNNQHYIQEYPWDEMLIEDDVELRPVSLWNWGIANRSGRLKWFPEDIVKLNLLPKDSATVTPRGILYKKSFYTCEQAIREYWFETARSRGGWKVEISYDPRNMNYIYFRTNNGRGYEKCRLLNDSAAYKDKRLEEIEYLIEYQKMRILKGKAPKMQADVELDDQILHVVEEAVEQTNRMQDADLSKAQRTKDIRPNRGKERERIRETEAIELGAKDINNTIPAEIIPIQQESKPPEVSAGYVSDLELLKRKQRDKLYGDKR